jgi:hypothetical protein
VGFVGLIFNIAKQLSNVATLQRKTEKCRFVAFHRQSIYLTNFVNGCRTIVKRAKFDGLDLNGNFTDIKYL